MATTLREIAAHLNLSPALVSRVLNNKPGIWASEATRLRVIEAAQAMNYRPSASARALVTGKTMQLAVSASDPDWFKGGSGRLLEVRGLIDAAAAHHYRVLVLASPEHHADRSQFEALIHSQGCDGFCVYAEQGDAGLYAWLQEHERPFVIIGNPGDSHFPQVDQDNYAQSFSSVRWLHEQGHRRIALVHTSAAQRNQAFLQVFERGYRDAMNELCGGADAQLTPEHCTSEAEILEFVRGVQAPSAVILRGLSSLLSWKLTLRASGVRVPEDVTLLAHLDTSELLHLREGALREGVALHIHDPHEAGVRAGELLINWINGQPAPAAPVLISSRGPCWAGDDSCAAHFAANRDENPAGSALPAATTTRPAAVPA